MRRIRARRRPLKAFLATTLLVGASFVQPTPSLAEVVRATRATELSPAAAQGWLAWTQNSQARPRRFNVFAKQAGGSRFKVNSRGTQGFTAGGAIDGTTLVYSQRKRRRGNVKLFDLNTRTRSNPPTGVNTSKHEWGASLSGEWLMFARTIFSTNTENIFLFNLSTGERRRLDTGRGDVYAQPGTVAGDYATWIKCRRWTRCRVFRREISSSTTTRLPNPQSRSQFAASVTPDGTVYYAESRNILNCKSSLRIYRAPVDSSRTRIEWMRRGRSVSTTSPLVSSRRRVEVFYDRFVCRTSESDIHKVSITV